MTQLLKDGTLVETGSGTPEAFLAPPLYAHALTKAIQMLRTHGVYQGAAPVDVFKHFLDEAKKEFVEAAPLVSAQSPKKAPPAPLAPKQDPPLGADFRFFETKGDDLPIGMQMANERVRMANHLLDCLRKNRHVISVHVTADTIIDKAPGQLGDAWPENRKTVQQVCNELGLKSFVPPAHWTQK